MIHPMDQPPSAEDIDRIGDGRVVASISGGKDSAAMSLWLTRHGIEHDRVFADTGWEHPDTYTYLRGVLTEKLGPIDEVNDGSGGFAATVRHKGMFPSRLRRWCTINLKMKPVREYLVARDDEPISAVGVRALESKKRAEMGRWEFWDGGDCEIWRPLIDWSEADVIDIHTDEQLPPNPLYLRGARRVGCWPCIHSNKRELRLVGELSPGRIDVIRDLERVVAAAIEVRGKTVPGKTIGMFAATVPGRDTAKRGWPLIDEVMAWAKTERGGRQMMLVDTEPAGCVRWGLCERAGDDDAGSDADAVQNHRLWLPGAARRR